MNQAAYSGGVPNALHAFRQEASDKNIAWKQRLHNPHHAPLRGPLHAQPRMKHFQSQLLLQVRHRYLLVFWLCPGAVTRPD